MITTLTPQNTGFYNTVLNSPLWRSRRSFSFDEQATICQYSFEGVTHPNTLFPALVQQNETFRYLRLVFRLVTDAWCTATLNTGEVSLDLAPLGEGAVVRQVLHVHSIVLNRNYIQKYMSSNKSILLIRKTQLINPRWPLSYLISSDLRLRLKIENENIP